MYFNKLCNNLYLLFSFEIFFKLNYTKNETYIIIFLMSDGLISNKTTLLSIFIYKIK